MRIPVYGSLALLAALLGVAPATGGRTLHLTTVNGSIRIRKAS